MVVILFFGGLFVVQKILLVEDDVAVQELWHQQITSLRWEKSVEVFTATTLSQAQELMSAHADLVVVAWDGNLPDGDSWNGAIQNARQILPRAHLLAIASAEDKRAWQLAAGCDEDYGSNIKIGVVRRICDILQEKILS